LKATLETLVDKHRKLLDSYSQQSETLLKLKGRITELHAQIAIFSIQSGRENGSFSFSYPTGHAPEFQQFDAFSFSSEPPSNQRAVNWDGEHVNNAGGNVSLYSFSSDLPEFEDLLNVP
jgi:hypothetical protein